MKCEIRQKHWSLKFKVENSGAAEPSILTVTNDFICRNSLQIGNWHRKSIIFGVKNEGIIIVKTLKISQKFLKF